MPAQVQQAIRELLRSDAAALVLGIIFCVAALTALAVFGLRSRSRERLLLWFGLLSGIYGLRLLASTDTFEILCNQPRDFWRYAVAIGNYIIIPPALLSIAEIYRFARRQIRWLAWLSVGYAAVAIVIGFTSGDPFAAPDPGSFLFVALPAAFLVAGRSGKWRLDSARNRPVTFGMALFFASVANEHLVNLRALPWNWRFEPFGFLVLVCCNGYAAVRRFIDNEQSLAAIQEEMRAASRIQASILPASVPGVNGLELAVRYAPMASVAGDFYDFAALGQDTLGILIADVTGHGVPAALVGSMVKVAFSMQSDHASDPARVIAGLNEVLCAQARGQLVTASYLVIDAARRKAVYSAAGHPPLLLWKHRCEEVCEVAQNGLLLGLRTGEIYSGLHIDLEPGDRLVLYTDGVPEAANASGELFGEDRLKQFVVRARNLPPDSAATALLEELNAWSGRNGHAAQSDDVTVIILDVK